MFIFPFLGDGHPPIFLGFPSWDDQPPRKKTPLGEASISEPARADSLKPMKLSDENQLHFFHFKCVICFASESQYLKQGWSM